MVENIFLLLVFIVLFSLVMCAAVALVTLGRLFWKLSESLIKELNQ